MYKEPHPGHTAFCGPGYIFIEERGCLTDPVKFIYSKWSPTLGSPPDPNNPDLDIDKAQTLLLRAVRRLQIERRFRQHERWHQENQTQCIVERRGE